MVALMLAALRLRYWEWRTRHQLLSEQMRGVWKAPVIR